ncbi:MAG: leucine-rich repeat protein, partial [Clostridia bacterium]|nr:leucine-rich repeat protein [Clostridia bacterium]
KAKVTNAGVLQAAIDAALGYEFGQCGNCVGYAWNQTTGKVVIGGCGPMTEYSSPRSPFYGSNEVKTVVIANGVTTVGKSAFSNCRKLESVTFPDDGSLAAIGEYAFEQCQSLQSVALPRELTTVGTAAFGECSALQSVTFPQGLTAIGAYAFEKCTSLQSVSLPQGLTTIGQRTFHMCTSLENITLPQGLTTIHSLAFYDTGLKSVTIPKSVTKIGDFAFAENSDLQTLNYTGSPADWATVTVAGNAFDNTPVNAPTCYYYGVEGAINAINDIGTVEYTDECKARIDAARAAYDALSVADRDDVTNYATLTAAENAYKALEVEALIGLIGTVEYTDECKEKIDAAQAAFATLTDAQQELVAPAAVATLTDAVNAYDFAGYKEAQKDAADALKQEGDSAACKALVAQARAAIDALTYDKTATLIENKLAAAAIVAQLSEDLIAQRKAEAATATGSGSVCPYCGKKHGVAPGDVLTRIAHTLVWFIKGVAKSGLYAKSGDTYIRIL